MPNHRDRRTIERVANSGHKGTNDGAARVLLFSQRHLHPALYRCPHREFEDVISEVDGVDLVAPQVARPYNWRYRIAKRIAYHSPVSLNPGVPKTKIEKKYDLLFTICGTPSDLLFLDAIENWQEVAKTSVCLMDELWVKSLPAYKWFLKILAKFDFIVLYYSQSVDAVRAATGTGVSFLPPGIDSLRFCPYPDLPARAVDVYSIGRRSEATHQKLLKMVMEDGIFYVHDTIAGEYAINSVEHRMLFANTVKRSKYFIVNPALIDRTNVRGDQNEIGNRYFEGAAAGAVMIGEIPTNPEFKNLFDWPDAVLRLPYGSAEIDGLIHRGRQPA